MLPLRNGVPQGCLRLLKAPPTLSEEEHAIAASAIDYRQVLYSRILHDDRVWLDYYVNDPQTDIAWDLIAYTQALPSGDLGPHPAGPRRPAPHASPRPTSRANRSAS